MKLWFGVLVENTVQSTAADLLRLTVTRIETNPALSFMPIRLHTHDEIVVEVDETRAEEAKALLRCEMLMPEARKRAASASQTAPPTACDGPTAAPGSMV